MDKKDIGELDSLVKTHVFQSRSRQSRKRSVKLTVLAYEKDASGEECSKLEPTYEKELPRKDSLRI